MGPSALRIAGLCERLIRLGYRVTDMGDLPVRIPESAETGDERLRFLDEITAVNRTLAAQVATSLAAGALPLVSGGDHSLSIGSIAGVASWARERSEEFGLLWFDAHPDMNTPQTTPSGNIHGMGLATALGYGDERLTGLGGPAPKVRAENVVLIGVRNVDPGERDRVLKSGINVLTMRDIDERGIVSVLEEALAIVQRDTIGFHVSWDMDFVDPKAAPGVGTPARGGVNYREAHLALELVNDTDGLISMDCVETNPILDDRNKTGTLAVELILSALGKTIL